MHGCCHSPRPLNPRRHQPAASQTTRCGLRCGRARLLLVGLRACAWGVAGEWAPCCRSSAPSGSISGRGCGSAFQQTGNSCVSGGQRQQRTVAFCGWRCHPAVLRMAEKAINLCTIRSKYPWRHTLVTAVHAWQPRTWTTVLLPTCCSILRQSLLYLWSASMNRLCSSGVHSSLCFVNVYFFLFFFCPPGASSGGVMGFCSMLQAPQVRQAQRPVCLTLPQLWFAATRVDMQVLWTHRDRLMRHGHCFSSNWLHLQSVSGSEINHVRTLAVLRVEHTQGSNTGLAVL